MATIVSFAPNRAVDLSGFSVPGARVTFYDSGTSRPRVVYADPACEVPHPSPLSADGAGVFPPVYDAGGGDVKAAVTTADGVMLAGYPMDPVRIIDTASVGAAGIQFDPTESIPETNVQAALERVQANTLQPLLDYGLGVTGNAPLLGDLDAAGIASGFYRYNGSTAGQFPSAVDKANTGAVMLLRNASSSAFMLLAPASSTAIYIRRQSGDWGPWTKLMTASDTVSNAVWQAGTSTAAATATPAAIRAAVNGDQSWQSLAGSRSIGTIYQNNTGRTIQVAICSNSGICEVSVDGSTGWVRVGMPTSDSRQFQSFNVPPGHRYRCRNASAIEFWSELR